MKYFFISLVVLFAQSNLAWAADQDYNHQRVRSWFADPTVTNFNQFLTATEPDSRPMDKTKFQRIAPEDIILIRPEVLHTMTAANISWITANQWAEIAKDPLRVRAFDMAQLKRLSAADRAIFIASAGSQLEAVSLAELTASPPPEKTGDPVPVRPVAVAPVVAAPVVVAPQRVAPTADASLATDNQTAHDYDASTCKWSTDVPKRIVVAPSCGRTHSNTCVGYVICTRKSNPSLNFVRMASCSPRFCLQNTDEGAKGCTKDSSRVSRKPTESDDDFASGRLRSIISGGAPSAAPTGSR